LRRALAAVCLALACAKHEASPPPPSHAAPSIADKSPIPKPQEAKTPAVPTTPPIEKDLDAIRAAGTISVLFTFNSTGYFIYRGETMGYEYELLTRFVHDAKLTLKPVVVRDSTELFEKLNRGEGDIVAAQLAATSNESEVAMTNSLYTTAPVLVQRKGDAANKAATPAVATAIAREEKETNPPPIEVHARLIETPQQLAGAQVHLPRNSPYRRNLLELNDALSDDINVVEVDDSSDKLIQETAEGTIAYTVAAENLAKLKTATYANLLIQPALGPPQPVVWAVRRNAPQLLKAIDDWLEVKRKSGLLTALYRKYFLDRRGFETRTTSQFLTSETGTLSAYDEWFREYAKIPGWDWRLIAAQAFQESKFNPRARSWAGAVGLMQIMPATARQIKVNPNDPRQSIQGACRYIWQLDDAWKDSITKESERIKFILASYNVGTGHVQDAVRLAKKHGDDPTSWQDVGYWLIQKSKRAVYNDPVVKHGYARGTEPVAYVDAIEARWENYRQFVTAEAPTPVATLNRRSRSR
jgi:membrane-bound lytic murein transglycosylase F